MPCGCNGGTWQPPETEKQQDGNSERQPAVPKPEPAATGPAAPGYYHGPDR